MSNPEEQLEKIRAGIDRLPNLSTTLHKVLEVCDEPDPSANDINRVIALDPVLTAQVLKLVNSAYYSLPSQIVSLTRAIIMLGINTVKNLALSLAVIGTFRGKGVGAGSGLDANNYWMHSLCVGVTAKVLARLKGEPRSDLEEYFIAGLLHDLGKIPMSREFPEAYRQVLKRVAEEERSLTEVEMDVFGFDHAMVGAIVMEKWRLSRILSDVLSFHHHPLDAPEEQKNFVLLVAIANQYANIFQIGDAGESFPSVPWTTELLGVAGIAWDDFMGLEEAVKAEITRAQVFLRAAS